MKCILIFLIPLLSFGQNEIIGRATYYADKFEGRKTASGEIYRHNKLTGASNFFKLGTKVRVTNLQNNKCVIIKINDRTSKKSANKGIVVDLTPKAMKLIKGKQMTKVKVEKLCG